MKTISIQNFNNKLANDYFIHIAAAPPNLVPENALPLNVIIEEIGGPYFEAQMIDFARCYCHQLSSIHTFMSHCVDRDEFRKKYITDPDRELAVYIYKKVKQ